MGTWFGPMVIADQEYEVTGVLDPDITGTYEPIGPYNGKPSYELTGNGWFLWWDGVDTWFISAERGSEAGANWGRTSPDIEGVYDPTVPATGDATVTEI